MTADWAGLIKGGESLKVEFKSQCPKLARLAKSISAFANSAGGTIFFGVSDSGELLGLEHIKGTRELVEKVASFYCDPPVSCALQEWEAIKGIKLLVVDIHEAEHKPVYAINPQNEADRWPYFRSEQENLPLDKKSLKTMRRIPSVPLEEDATQLDRTERQILDVLAKTPRRTLGQVGRALNISSHRAKKALVRMEQKGWVHSFFNAKCREFSLAVEWRKRT